jgi:GT2 family glycosyltransferase
MEKNVPDLNRRMSVVILTYNRRDEVRHTLGHMLALPQAVDIIVIDNASTDGTQDLVHFEFPQVRFVRLPRNVGAAARNIGVEMATTPYIAFCDDDSWWAAGSLERAADILDAHPRVAALCARILLGPQEIEDPVCQVLANSPLPSAGLPGRALLGFIACATVVRRAAYLQAGGYEQRFFVGGEEELLSIDLVSNGWSVVYVPELTIHHHPSPQRDNPGRQKIVLRNTLWVSWLRLPFASALRQTWTTCRSARDIRTLAAAMLEALRELPWVWRERRVISPRVHQMYRVLRD